MDFVKGLKVFAAGAVVSGLTCGLFVVGNYGNTQNELSSIERYGGKSAGYAMAARKNAQLDTPLKRGLFVGARIAANSYLGK